MIKIKSFGSSSAGNAYLIDDGQSQLMIECGVQFSKIKQKMEHDFSRVDGCLISHEHRDHCRYVKNLLADTSVDVYATRGTIEAMKTDSELKIPRDSDYRFSILRYKRPQQVGTWTVTAFETQHDVAEPCGFYVESQKGESLLFVTDSYYLKYTFPKVNYLMIEMNYSDEIISGNLSDNQKLKTRIMESHFDYKQALKFIRKNKSEQLKEIWLLHLSNDNSNEKLFKKETQQLTGVPVYVA